VFGQQVVVVGGLQLAEAEEGVEEQIGVMATGTGAVPVARKNLVLKGWIEVVLELAGRY
jgi:hypothetical protein